MSDLVSVEPLREAFERSGRGAVEIASILEVKGGTGNPDGSGFLKMIGALSYNPGRGYPPRTKSRCSYSMALKIIDAIGADPVDVGL